MQHKVIYLDHSATTPLDPQVREAMEPYFSELFFNPGGMYLGGLQAGHAVTDARQKIADALGCDPAEVVFTSGGTEANNLALRGTMSAHTDPGHIITTAVEHHSILHTCDALEKLGHEVTILPVDGEGRVTVGQVHNALRPNTRIVSVMWANNEIGTIQPIEEIAELLRDHSAVFHTDAVQAVGKIAIGLQKTPIDFLSLSGHKFYGPKGVGVLIARRGKKLLPQVTGGGQESNRRSGTENVPGIVGIAEALKLSVENLETENARLIALREYAFERILNEFEHIRVNGPRENRLPNNLHVSFWGIEGESILLKLNQNRVCASTGSACTSATLDASHVVTALGIDVTWAHGGLRLSFGKSNTIEQVDQVIDWLHPIVDELRKMSPVTPDQMTNARGSADFS